MTHALQDMHWPDGLDAKTFIARYWQQQALWMPQALADFAAPIGPDELAGLALEEDIASRLLIERADGRHDLEHGPFEVERFAELDGKRFSLLIPDVDKHLPALAQYLNVFDFIPRWRMDDLMISHAPDGGSVGAHVDAYDVFLLQATGSREWLIDTRADADQTTDPDSGVRQLANFEATESRVLHPGDMLYLPPGVPHHGIARGDSCTTWSIGFRAPSASQLVASIAEKLADSISDAPLSDPNNYVGAAGQITAATLASYRAAWQHAIDLDDDAFADLLGQVLTANGDPSTDIEPLSNSTQLQAAPWTRLAWYGDVEPVQLFINGEHVSCSRALAQALCGRAGLTLEAWQGAERELLQHLMDEGVLVEQQGLS